jgi:hypothetical protein
VAVDEQKPPFDEKAALAELERLRESIQAARQARQRTSDEFEAFVKSFRKPAPVPVPELTVTPASESPAATSRASEAPQGPAPDSIDRSPRSLDPLPPPPSVPSTTDSFDDKAARPPLPLPRRYRLDIRSLGVLAFITVIALILFATRSGRGTPPPPTTLSNGSDKAALARNAAVSPPAVTQSTPASAAARGVTIELRVIRPVWMRVVVDGRKDVEGTVQPGEPLHFAGNQSIVVRVGNGGDIVVKTGDREESFGPAAQPLTRTFSKP